MVEPDVGIALAQPLFDRVRPTRIGAVSRPDPWWSGEWAQADAVPPRRRFDVVYEVDGRTEGYALYVVSGEWTGGHTEKVVEVRDLIAASPAAEAALWTFLLNVDQTVAVRAWNTPLDTELPWMLTDPRQYRTDGVRDFLWLRPVDTAALLAARTYATRENSSSRWWIRFSNWTRPSADSRCPRNAAGRGASAPTASRTS